MKEELSTASLSHPDVSGLARIVDSAVVKTHAERQHMRNRDLLDGKGPREHIETCLNEMCTRAYSYVRVLEEAGRDVSVSLYDHRFSKAYSITIAGEYGPIVTLTGHPTSDTYTEEVNVNAFASKSF